MTDEGTDDDYDVECPVCKSCGEFYCGCGGNCTPADPRCRYGASLAQQAEEDRISQAEYEAAKPTTEGV